MQEVLIVRAFEDLVEQFASRAREPVRDVPDLAAQIRMKGRQHSARERHERKPGILKPRRGRGTFDFGHGADRRGKEICLQPSCGDISSGSMSETVSPSKIRKLPEDLIGKIAAGEVIERPFSVIKELVENSIDAGARQIEVDVEEGGRKRMTILDDGIGMTEDEAVLALERHATSKLPDEETLFNIRTLGFRGEALPSIASVSFMTIETRPAADPASVATKIEIEGGKILKPTASPLPRGTRIAVKNLFFNTPARLKFLKAKETEFSHVASWIESMALARPDIGFTLKHNEKTELKVLPGELRQRIGDVLGGEIAEHMHAVSGRRGALSVTGFVSDHHAGSFSPKSLYFFVNGRIVRDRTLQHGVMAAYENLLMKHRYPWAVLYLQVPPDFVDVNVHPTKNEVRFVNSSLVHELVREGVKEALHPHHHAEVSAPSSLFHFQNAQEETIFSPRLDQAMGDSVPAFDPAPDTPHQENALIPFFRVIGQAHGTYLICESDDKLVLIDQHAAHERIGFEKLKKQYETGGISRQQLLIPRSFDLRPSQGEILKKYTEELAKVGLDIEFFGGNTFLLRAMPALLEGTDVIRLIEELIESLDSFEKLTPLEEKIHEVLERMACHRQIRAGQRLVEEEIQALLNEMKETPFAGQCPHGRPSILEIPFGEMEKWFKRKV